ncbi:MAG: class I SAM-dependent methyltransferase [Polyangiales bacterium]
MNQVGEFFDARANDYHASRGGMAPFHALTSARIEVALEGRVAALGGLWAGADGSRCASLDLTIVDVSPNMLEHWAAAGYRTLHGDARDTPFEDASLDHVVLPLVLHHITEGSWSRARAQVQLVFAEALRILRPGGTLWISDFSVPNGVYAAERLASGVTRRVLALAGIPLVVMHTQAFYETSLRDAGFDHVDSFVPQPESTSSWDMLTPVIGLDWLRVPRILYPIRPVLISARTPD